MSDLLIGENTYRYSVREAAAYLGMPAKSLYRIASEGGIDHLRTGCQGKVAKRVIRGKVRTVRAEGQLRFSKAGLDAWIEAHRARVTAKATPRPVAASGPRTLPMPEVRRFA